MLLLVPTLREIEILFGIESVKKLELHPCTKSEFAGKQCYLGYLGFGNIASGVLTSYILSEIKNRDNKSLGKTNTYTEPAIVYLLGICGSFDPILTEIGSAVMASAVISYGIGVGSAENYLSPNKINIPQYKNQQLEIYDKIELPSPITSPVKSYDFLSVCSASANLAEAKQRKSLFPNVACEEMEGFGVALACKLALVKFTMIRGVSNIVGDRDKQSWKIHSALNSVKSTLLEIL